MPACHVTHQPASLTSMDPYYDHYNDKKSGNPPEYICQDGECEESHAQSHRTCHKSRLRRLLIPAMMVVVTLAAIIFISCIQDLAAMGIFGQDDGVLGLGKRDTSNGSFVNNKCAFCPGFRTF